MTPATDDPDPPDADLVRPYLPRPAGPGGDGVGGTGPVGPLDATEDDVVRPYLQTAGRVYTGTEVRIETQVMATGTRPHGAGLDPDQRRVLSACAEPLSVAELAAQAGLHLGVAILLVADLAQRGDVTLFLPQLDPQRRVDIIRKVMSGLDVLC